MLFNSIEFLIFFPIAVVIYYIVPAKYRYLWLLIASYYFYMQWEPIYGLLLFTTTTLTYIGGLLIEKTELHKNKKIAVAVVVFINLAILGYFKYTNMFVGLLNDVISFTGHETIPWDHNIILPVGISFFTLQSLGYLIDVYRGDIYAEHNFFRYALFISFFPQLVAGPIERSKNLLKQLAVPKKLSYDNVRKGMLIMLYGYLLKVVIADRIAIYVDAVYGNPSTYPGAYIVIACLLFSIQIYCDFYGYSILAKGAAKVLGIDLMDNFKAPYYARSIAEYWRRWHISLSSWFKDYLYIPLGGNRKGTLRKYTNVLIIFTVSGLWHGASMTFVVWGLLHGMYQVLGSLIRKALNWILDKIKCTYTFGTYTERVLNTIVTYCLVSAAWPLFRGNTLRNAITIYLQMISNRNPFSLVDQSIFNMGIERGFWKVLILAIGILAFVDYQKFKDKDVVEAFFRQHIWFRILSTVGMLVFVILFGCYGSAYNVQQFIYFQF